MDRLYEKHFSYVAGWPVALRLPQAGNYSEVLSVSRLRKEGYLLTAKMAAGSALKLQWSNLRKTRN